jgi:guanidinobutyrase
MRRKEAEIAARQGSCASLWSLSVADIGDVPTNPYSLEKSVNIIERFYDGIMAHELQPVEHGRRSYDRATHHPRVAEEAWSNRHRACRRASSCMSTRIIVHVDAHGDVNDTMFGEKVCHGTPFRRLVEEKLVDPNRVVQIGLRGIVGSARRGLPVLRHDGDHRVIGSQSPV